jgi:hypothetical protein
MLYCHTLEEYVVLPCTGGVCCLDALSLSQTMFAGGLEPLNGRTSAAFGCLCFCVCILYIQMYAHYVYININIAYIILY